MKDFYADYCDRLKKKKLVAENEARLAAERQQIAKLDRLIELECAGKYQTPFFAQPADPRDET